MIFIVGNSRSGTTMLGRIFGLRSDVHTFGELQCFEKYISAEEMQDSTFWPREKLISAAERLLTSSRGGLFAKVVAGQYTDEAEKIVDAHQTTDPMALYAAVLRSETAREGKSIPCEQTPYYLFVSKEILSAYPEARIIHIYRDPRDVLLSQKNRWRRGFWGNKRQPLIWILRSWSNYHPYLTSRLWSSAMREADSLREQDRFMEISYEQLLTEPESSLRALCDHVGVAFESIMLEVPQVGSSSRKDTPTSAGLDKSRIGSWRQGGLNRAEIGICERNAETMMQARAYEISGIRSSLPTRLFMKGTLVAKLGLALALNLNRFRNIISAVRRRT